MIKIVAIYLLFSSVLIGKEFALFHPPQGWEYASLKNSSPYTKVGFIGKGSGSFHPSMNLAIEEIDGDEKRYIESVKKIHLTEPDTSWRDFGQFKTEAGIARLTEITKKLSFGDIKILQMIFIKNQKAYLLTAACSKKDYLKEQEALFESFHSFVLTENLLNSLSQEEKKSFEEIFISTLPSIQEKDMKKAFTTKDWQDFQKKVADQSVSMGKYWEILMLQEGIEKLSQQNKYPE